MKFPASRSKIRNAGTAVRKGAKDVPYPSLEAILQAYVSYLSNLNTIIKQSTRICTNSSPSEPLSVLLFARDNGLSTRYRRALRTIPGCPNLIDCSLNMAPQLAHTTQVSVAASVIMLGGFLVEKFTNLVSILDVHLFDTPENRVITSGLTLASFSAFFQQSQQPEPNLAK